MLAVMRKVPALAVCTCLTLLLTAALVAAQDGSEPAGGHALVLRLDGPIGPAGSDFFLRELEKAEAEGAGILVLGMDTPGGLDSSMRDIIQAILAARIPVAAYVSPEGARAASAGTYILYASHVAAMAPATNLGAATPVKIGGMPGTPGGDEPEPPKPGDGEGEGMEKPDPAPPSSGKAMERKIVNDARAYIRSLAQRRGRNVEWADQAVTEAATLTAEEALAAGVIDLVAKDVPDLLAQAHGRTVDLDDGPLELATLGLEIREVEPDWRSRLLALITDPQVAYILMLLGIYGLFFELSNPGALVPGVLGAICLLLALFAFQVLPVNYAGLALILLGLLFMIAEAFVPSFGILGIGGVVAFIAGSVMLWEETGPGFTVPIGIIGGFALASLVLLLGFARLMVRQRRRPVVSGAEELLGATGVALEDFDAEGRVRVHGEIWQASSTAALHRHQPITVTGRHGLVLSVKAKPNEGED